MSSVSMSDAVLSSIIKIHIYLGVVCFESTILLGGLRMFSASKVISTLQKNAAKVPLLKYHSCFVEQFQPFVLPADTAVIALLFI